MASVATATTARRLSGYIDAAADGRIFGWALDPQRPEARIAIRVVSGDDVIAAVVADQKRDDLVQHRIGDGAHAFEIALPDGLAPASVRVLAVCPDSGETLELTPPPPTAATSVTSVETKAMLELLVRAQRGLQQEVRALRTELNALRDAQSAARTNADEASSTDPAAAIGTIETAIFRIDDKLQRHQTRLDKLQLPAADHVSRVLAGIALILGVGALAISWIF